MTIRAVILAGGRSQRMGGSDKGLIELDGIPLVAHVARRLRPQVGTLSVIANRNLSRYRELVDDVYQDRDFLPDIGCAGPLVGIYAALVLAGGRGHVLIAPCDVPFLPKDLLQRLLGEIIATGARACYAHDGQRQHYLCALLDAALAPDLHASLVRGERSAGAWLRSIHARAVDCSDAHDAFLNVNTPADVEHARQQAAAASCAARHIPER